MPSDASRAGVRRIIYLGGLSGGVGSLSAHLKSRAETGDMLREYARLRGLRRLLLPVPLLTPHRGRHWLALWILALERLRTRSPAAAVGRLQNAGHERPDAILDLIIRSIGANKSLYEDRIEYALPGSPFIQRLTARPLRHLLARAFARRHTIVRARFAHESL